MGTLYSAKNFLRANNVPPDPMKDFHACEELAIKYTDALILAAAMDHFGMDSLDGEPTRHERGDESEENYIKDQLAQIVDTYAIHYSPDGQNVESGLVCPVHDCNKSYKTAAGLKAHVKSKHPTQVDTVSKKATIAQYCKTALGMFMLAMDFADARKHGDGERIVRLYKFLILHFRAVGKDNYARYTLRVIAQVKALLTPRLAHQVTWNRFVNNQGHVDSNVECDRENEHLNKQTKGQIRTFQGKVSDSSIKRVSESVQTVQSIITQADREAHIKRPSGKHERVDSTSDVRALVEVFHQEAVFSSERKLKAVPSFHVNPFARLNMGKTCVWMRSSLKDFSQHKGGR